jgi:glycosyltransferase involved in cell wall biosynthesis
MAQTNTKRKLVSIVISAYNESENIDRLYSELCENTAIKDRCVFEFIFVNDGSTDDTFARIKRIARSDKRIKILDFTRNFGHEIAMTAGMGYARGDCIIFMDADMQNPVDLIGEMIDRWLNGAKIVLTRRIKNLDEGLPRRIANKIFYAILNFLSDIYIAPDTPDFRLIDKKYVDILKTMDERERMFRGMLRWIGLKNYEIIDFIAPKRFKGKTKYGLSRSIQLAINSIVQFSIKPLRLATFIGVIAAFVSIVFGMFEIVDYLSLQPDQISRSAIILVVIFFGSIQLIVLGIVGEYIGRIHIETKRRPLYIADFYSNDEEQEQPVENQSKSPDDLSL